MIDFYDQKKLDQKIFDRKKNRSKKIDRFFFRPTFFLISFYRFFKTFFFQQIFPTIILLWTYHNVYSGLAFTRYSNIVPLKTIKNHPKPSNIRKNHQKSQKTWKSIKNHQNLFVFDIFPRLPYPSSTLYRSDSCGGRSKSKKHFKTLK